MRPPRPCRPPRAHPPTVRPSHARRTAAPPPPAASPLDEVSPAAHENVVLFLLQQDCDVALNRSLAMDAFDAAAAVRERRRRVDDALAALKAARQALGDGVSSDSEGGGGTAAPPPPADDGVDAALRGVRLRAELADAIAAEDYGLAASIRDALKEVEAATAAAAARDAVRAERAGAPPALRLGQRVVHKEAGYRGVVCG